MGVWEVCKLRQEGYLRFWQDQAGGATYTLISKTSVCSQTTPCHSQTCRDTFQLLSLLGLLMLFLKARRVEMGSADTKLLLQAKTQQSSSSGCRKREEMVSNKKSAVTSRLHPGHFPGTERTVICKSLCFLSNSGHNIIMPILLRQAELVELSGTTRQVRVPRRGLCCVRLACATGISYDPFIIKACAHEECITVSMKPRLKLLQRKPGLQSNAEPLQRKTRRYNWCDA
jgi:hypothetical protein